MDLIAPGSGDLASLNGAALIYTISPTHRLCRTPTVTGLCAALLLVMAAGQATAATEFTVTNTNDSGPGSLRQAILDSNAAFNSAHDTALRCKRDVEIANPKQLRFHRLRL